MLSLGEMTRILTSSRRICSRVSVVSGKRCWCISKTVFGTDVCNSAPKTGVLLCRVSKYFCVGTERRAALLLRGGAPAARQRLAATAHCAAAAINRRHNFKRSGGAGPATARIISSRDVTAGPLFFLPTDPVFRSHTARPLSHHTARPL